MEQRPIRLYLDQKDFSRIGKGLAGNALCDGDVEAYRTLLTWAEQDRVRVYFSWSHAMEALRYDKEKLDLLGPYCEAVDALTHGHSIR